jgi:pimeloyl-ACP methyl ester carboxylesterase
LTRRWSVGLAVVALLLLCAPAAEAKLDLKRCGRSKLFQCGRMTVPLDRTGAVPGRVSLFVLRVRARRGGGATRPPVVALAGGPGQSASDAFAITVNGRLLDELDTLTRDRDLIIYDQRGSGRSDLLRCRPLEDSNLLDAGRAAARCARRLGPRRAFYTSRDTADDIDALRAELGAEQVALYGTSYGTKVALAYSLRYPARVERLVLDSVAEVDGPNPFYLDSFQAVPRALHALCRGGHCPWTRDAAVDIAALVDRLARGPMRGRVIDRRGRPRLRRLTRLDVFSILLAGDFDPVLRAASPASVRAALEGDPTPLLRLRRRALEIDAEPPPNPRPFSTALYAATSCEEAPLPWDRSTPPDPAERHRQAAARAATIPDSEFEPFDRATSLASDVLNLCERWPAAPLAPDFGPGPLPDVPVLLLEGEDDLRTPVENAQRVAAQFPRSSLVVAPATGHSVLGSDFSGCALRAFESFFRDEPVITRCGGARARRIFRPSPPPPRRLSGVTPLGARGRPGRTLAAVRLTLIDVAEDSITEQVFDLDDPDLARGGGLRAGHYSIDRNNTATLDGVAFVPGVRVTGRLAHFGERSQLGQLRVGGPAAARGVLRLRGGQVSGRLGGRRVRAGVYGRRAISALAAQRQHRGTPAAR